MIMRISICLGYARGHISPFINLTVVAACQEYNHRGEDTVYCDQTLLQCICRRRGGSWRL